MLLSMELVGNQRKDNHTSPYRRGPICSARCNWYADGKAAEDDYEAGVAKCKSVDGQSETTQTPACPREFFALDALEQDTANGHHVGRHESEEGERDDDVEGEGGA